MEGDMQLQLRLPQLSLTAMATAPGFSDKRCWIGEKQILQAKILAVQALENSEMFVTLQGCGDSVIKESSGSFN